MARRRSVRRALPDFVVGAAELPQVRQRCEASQCNGQMLSLASSGAKARAGLRFQAAVDGLLAAQQLVPVLLHQAQSFLNRIQ
jgi:hypothetical protein